MERRVIDIAKVFMLAYLGDSKERLPSDFDEDILGITLVDTEWLVTSHPQWNRSVFYEALGELITEKKVTFSKDEKDDTYRYKAAEKQLRLEDYILDLIKKRETDLEKLVAHKDQYTERDYHGLCSRYRGSIDDLYMSLTAHNNPLSQVKVQ